MKKKYLAKAGVFALAAGIILPSTAAYGEALPSSISTESININEVSSETPIFDVYDKDKNLIKTYTKGEIDKLNQSLVPNPLVDSNDSKLKEETLVTPLAMNVYNLQPTSFGSYRWINGGMSFYRPQSVHVEASNTVRLGVEVYRDDVKEGEVVPRGSFSGGLNIPISHLTDGWHNYYKLLLRNHGGGTVKLSGGQVYYK
ncbi:hypothetical protein [Bacillus pseudomycoides]|uniref:hypothetical protein n=1 Tax=Bacillus pseudomycoides TaxID=64104 RepID=UPI000BEC0E4B|nr:hypothetical protein [Bacillus pseudomycoides]PDX97285.1 hypothetical protein COO07_28315 [Bacillus pseudomycoides]PED08323.1 hypothetical protein COO19_10800 [Bacillus pseudomycoides]PEF72045.1 hypothetical protein CON94_28550 [Bacillus pseudomycoides]PEK73623.1 hypothetical protein CN597_28495 [Bacillus pseudomycoides]PEL72685.1 hypothetical protein CN615_29575 [Bacillus pseudomycoides]